MSPERSETRRMTRSSGWARRHLRIDFLRRVTGVEFDDAWPRRVMVDWEGVSIPILGMDDLIAAKRAAGRDRDLLDVKNLERAKTRRTR